MTIRQLMKRASILACLLTAITVSTSTLADPKPVPIDRAFSGVWDQPDHRSQGFLLQIAETGDGEMLGVAYWFTYGADLQSAWYVAVGPIVDDRIDMTLYEASGVGFLDGPLGEDSDAEPIGTLQMWFKNCQHGTVNWESDDEMLGTGEVRIKRLTKIYRMECAQRDRDRDDDKDDEDDAEEGFEVEIDLTNTGVVDGAEGEAEYEEEGDKRQFKVEIDGVGPGVYPVQVGELEVGVIEVEEDGGKLKFAHPESDRALPLDFLVLGKEIKVWFEGEVILEGVIPEA